MGNFNLSGSFAIGGFILLTILGIYLILSDYSQDSLVNDIAQGNVNNMQEIIDYELSNIGNGSGAALLTTNNDTLKFKAELDEKAAGLEEVKYYRKIEKSDTFFVRNYTIAAASAESELKVSLLSFGYYTKAGVLTTDKNLVASIKIRFLYLPEGKPVNYESSSLPVFFEKCYYPRNLNL
jgi:hypothetical protein